MGTGTISGARKGNVKGALSRRLIGVRRKPGGLSQEKEATVAFEFLFARNRDGVSKETKLSLASDVRRKSRKVRSHSWPVSISISRNRVHTLLVNEWYQPYQPYMHSK